MLAARTRPGRGRREGARDRSRHLHIHFDGRPRGGPDRDDGARVYAQFVPVLVGAGWFATMTVVARARCDSLAH